MNVNGYKSWDSYQWDAFFKAMKVNKDRVVVEPKIEIGCCAKCGNEGGTLRESEPSTARFDEGAVHYIVECKNKDCSWHSGYGNGRTWHILPPEAVDDFNHPENFTLKDNE